MTYYKWLKPDGTSLYAEWQWPLPTEDGHGAWTPYVERLDLRDGGYHASTLNSLIGYTNSINNLACYEVEFDGDVLVGDDKVAGHKARLVRKVGEMDARKWRLLACDYAERVLPIYEQKYPNDARPRATIEVARRYANGKTDFEEMDAARTAARTAAWAAARDAAGAAARDAARAAARAAAWAAARDAARAAEKEWQGQRLMEYLREAI